MRFLLSTLRTFLRCSATVALTLPFPPLQSRRLNVTPLPDHERHHLRVRAPLRRNRSQNRNPTPGGGQFQEREDTETASREGCVDHLSWDGGAKRLILHLRPHVRRRCPRVSLPQHHRTSVRPHAARAVRARSPRTVLFWGHPVFRAPTMPRRIRRGRG